MREKSRYLLITSCSKRKRRRTEAAALDLYDGPSFRVLRRRLQANVDVLIMSAEYGLIDSTTVVEPYDKRMDPLAAQNIAPRARMQLARRLKHNQYKEILINLPNHYRTAFRNCESLIAPYSVSWVAGTIGERLHQLKVWLIDTGRGSRETA